MENDFSHSRRQFLKQAAIAGAVLPSINLTKNIIGEDQQQPWYRTVTRWESILPKKILKQYDIKWWRGYWKRTSIQGVIINAGGIVAYYPTKIHFHKQAEYLKGSDLFGDLCRAAHEDGLAVFARMDSNRAHQEFYDQHPDWFALDKNGKPYKAGELYLSCVNSPYYNNHIPSFLPDRYQL